MPFKKGESGNPAGKPQGTRNKTTRQMRDLISGFLADNFEDVVEAFEELKPREKVKAYVDLLQYAIPKMQSTQLKSDFEAMTDEELEELVKTLNENYLRSIKNN